MGRVMIGADIGQKRDPTAIVVAEAEEREIAPAGAWQATKPDPLLSGADFRRPPARVEIAYTIRHMERRPLGEAYPAIASRIAEVVRNTARIAGMPAALVVDATGVGAPVVDILRVALKGSGCRLTAATFTHGDRLTGRIGQPAITVGKAYLVSRLQALLQTGRLTLPADHPEAPALARELLDYEIKVDQDANDRYGAFRTGAHDDLVTALGLAVLHDPPRPSTLQWL